MTDHLSLERRSWNMSRIPSLNTLPEKRVRSIVHRLGYRFRLNRKTLPGKPDIVLPKHKTVIFVHGCFWHRHKKCQDSTTPKSNTAFWIEKFEKNVNRDKKIKRQLRFAGWQIIVVWECEIKKVLTLEKKLKKFLSRKSK